MFKIFKKTKKENNTKKENVNKINNLNYELSKHGVPLSHTLKKSLKLSLSHKFKTIFDLEDSDILTYQISKVELPSFDAVNKKYSDMIITFYHDYDNEINNKLKNIIETDKKFKITIENDVNKKLEYLNCTISMIKLSDLDYSTSSVRTIKVYFKVNND